MAPDKLTRPVAQVSRADIAAWLGQNPDGRIVVEFGATDPELSRLRPEYVQAARDRVIVIFSRSSICGNVGDPSPAAVKLTV